MSNLATRPYIAFILGFLTATSLSASIGWIKIDPSHETSSDSPLAIGSQSTWSPSSAVAGYPEIAVPARAVDASRLWADLLTDGWEHIIDPLTFDEFAVEYCALRMGAARTSSTPYADLAATGTVDAWARDTLGYEHHTKQDRQTVASLVVALGYGCTGAA